MMSSEKEPLKGHSLPKLMKQITSTKTVEDLSDDALFLIFKNLNCTEIANASSVCRRWHDLAFDYSVWIQRHVKAIDIGKRETLEKILTSIPVVHTLDFTRTCVEDSTIRTILKSSIRIRNLKLYDCTIERTARSSINAVLRHISINLEGLSIELQNIMHNSSGFNLSEMVNLRSLTLVGNVYSDDDLQEFSLDCPLESLDLYRYNNRTYSYSDQRRYLFASNLINKAKGKLKTLHLPIFCNETILNSVRQCDYLTSISLQLEYIAVIAHLPLIETMIVHCDSSANPPSTWKRPNNLKELVLYLRQPKDVSVNFLKNIRAPSLTLVSDNLCKELEQFCSDTIERLFLKCHSLRLRHLSVTISTKMAMPNLKYLDVRECFLGKGVPPKILAVLKRRIPGLIVHSDQFVGYQKKRENRYDVECVLQESTDCSDTE